MLTVLAPCTISLLPVIVGGSVAEGHNVRRAIIVTASLGLSVILFTLILKVSTAFINIPQEFWQLFSGTIIALLGLSMLFHSLYDRLPWNNVLSRSSNKLVGVGYQKKNFIGDVIMGAALGPVFSSCSPTYFLILATVLPRSLGTGIIYLLAYAIGLSGALLVVCFAGQKLMARLGVASDPSGWIKRSVGILFLIVGIAICFGFDKTVESAITNAGYFDVTKIEQNLLVKELPSKLDVTPPAQSGNAPASGNAAATPAVPPSAAPASPSGASSVQFSADAKARTAEKALLYPRAPEITDPSGFINTGGVPITIGQYIGKKVILVDFWTYSCINCQRTLPYVKAWYDKNSSQGLEIISIHTPEFAFEKVQANVQQAVTDAGIKYPVVMDNDYGTWNAFGNQFWPHKYLIDIDGFISYDHAGEGDYDVTEAAIQKALAERATVLGENMKVASGTVAPTGVVTVDANGLGSPETYFGSNRNEYLGNGTKGESGTQTLVTPSDSSTNSNTLYLGGTWQFNPEYAEASAAGDSVVYKYQAKNVYFVASSSNPNGSRVRIMIDGQPAGAMAGADVAADGTLTIKDDRLYSIVSGSDYGTHTLTIQVLDSGLDAYTFTFG